MNDFVKFMRDGKPVWPYCSACGCRLEISAKGTWVTEAQRSLSHFGLSPDHDARGCKCPKLFSYQIVLANRVAEFI